RFPDRCPPEYHIPVRRGKRRPEAPRRRGPYTFLLPCAISRNPDQASNRDSLPITPHALPPVQNSSSGHSKGLLLKIPPTNGKAFYNNVSTSDINARNIIGCLHEPVERRAHSVYTVRCGIDGFYELLMHLAWNHILGRSQRLNKLYRKFRLNVPVLFC